MLGCHVQVRLNDSTQHDYVMINEMFEMLIILLIIALIMLMSIRNNTMCFNN